MIVVRSALFNLFLWTWSTLTLSLMWVFLPFPRTVMQEVVRFWAYGPRLGLKWIAGIDYEIRGRENLPQGACIFAAKHQSAWDTIAFFHLVEEPIYVIKKELRAVPFWGWYTRKCEAITVDRAAGAKALKGLLRDARVSLSKGRQVIIFPEGTRTPPGQHAPYQPGIAALYAHTSVPVVPVAVNSGMFWGRRSFIKHPGTIILEFLPAMPEGLDRRAFLAELEARVEAASERLRIEAETRFPGVSAASGADD